MPTVTWLHISDLHWRESEAYDANVVAQALLRGLDKRGEQIYRHLHPRCPLALGRCAQSEHGHARLLDEATAKYLTVTSLGFQRKVGLQDSKCE